MVGVLQSVGWSYTVKNCPTSCPTFKYLNGYFYNIRLMHIIVQIVDCVVFGSTTDIDLLGMAAPQDCVVQGLYSCKW